jgi:hypothetical protein
MSNEVLWDIAKNSSGDVIRISNDSPGPFSCLECGHEMFPIRGEELQHHFRHSSESDCSGESAKHWMKKYEIHDILREIGESSVEGAIGKYYADVQFEREWAFEVVYSNPPSEEKMRDLKDRLIIFNFNDWNQDNGDPFEGRSFQQVVLDLGHSIMNGETPDVCSNCREVKGWMSRLKSNSEYGPCCVTCDFDWFCKNR